MKCETVDKVPLAVFASGFHWTRNLDRLFVSWATFGVKGTVFRLPKDPIHGYRIA